MVDAEEWKNECEYYQLLYYDLNNENGKFTEQIEAIAKNIKVDVHTDQRMLELLRSVILPTGELTKLLKLDDILIEKSEDSLMKLKYQFDKAIQLSLVSDNEGAKKIADELSSCSRSDAICQFETMLDEWDPGDENVWETQLEEWKKQYRKDCMV